jgi:hypothetical protein
VVNIKNPKAGNLNRRVNILGTIAEVFVVTAFQ